MLAPKKVQEYFGKVYFDEQPSSPIFIKTEENRMAWLLKLAGLSPELTPHLLRHTYTSLLAEAKMGLEEITVMTRQQKTSIST